MVVTGAGQAVARHQRSWAKHRSTVTPPRARPGPRSACAAGVVAVSRTPSGDDVEVRDLSVYDPRHGGGLMARRKPNPRPIWPICVGP